MATNMSLSKQDRADNLKLAYRLIMDALGDDAITNVRFELDAAAFAEILPTTWKELDRHGFIDTGHSTFGKRAFCLTGYGWSEACKQLRLLTEWRPQIIALRAAIKDCLKGRHSDAMVQLEEIAYRSGLSQSWVKNAIESDLLMMVFPSDHMCLEWLDPPARRMVKIPSDFGLEML